MLSPEQAVQKALAVGAVIPHLAVIGIAGPGDPLANPEPVFATLRELKRQAPDLLLCLSTNGLALPEHADALAEHGVNHVTITINCVDPDIGAQIYPWIRRHGRLRGREAAETLIAQQLLGLDRLIARGVQVKINSVLIPGINDAHLPEVSRVVREKGAMLHNIMPLIARAEHGTYYGLKGQREPTAAELAEIRTICGTDGAVMSHCQQCRADATGILNDDRSAEFSMEKVAAMVIDPQVAMAKREAVRSAIVHRLQTRPDKQKHRLGRTPIRLRGAAENVLRLAVGSMNRQTVDAHFGHLRELLIYQVSADEIELVEQREIARYCHGATTCGDSEEAMTGAILALSDCVALLCARVGFTPWRALENAGIEPNSEHGNEPIEIALRAVYEEWRANGRLPVTAISSRAVA